MDKHLPISDSYKKSLLLNVGAFRDGYCRLLTFVDLTSSNINANPFLFKLNYIQIPTMEILKYYLLT
ncbi:MULTISPECIES: hypothetical protein [Flavobacterium]|uniref:Uncharacterized protein n=1 Tax=Flavobacterium hankyongi TaxID=1176532 RepID=A0ABP8ZV98_9FLAO|nr:hypothetical protein [Flavobacterium sp. N1846]